MQLASSCRRLRHRAGASSSACRLVVSGVTALRPWRQRDVAAGGSRRRNVGSRCWSWCFVVCLPARCAGRRGVEAPEAARHDSRRVAADGDAVRTGPPPPPPLLTLAPRCARAALGGRTAVASRVGADAGAAHVAAALLAAPARAALGPSHPGIATVTATNVRHYPAARVVASSAHHAGASTTREASMSNWGEDELRPRPPTRCAL